MNLKKLYTIIIVPHSIQQAARVADQAAFRVVHSCLRGHSGQNRSGGNLKRFRWFGGGLIARIVGQRFRLQCGGRR